MVLNYTNPMATLTNVFYKVSGLKTVGLCRGTNHFFWITDLKIRGEDGYDLLKRKMTGKAFADLVTDVYVDGAGFHSNKWVCSELFDHYGYLPNEGQIPNLPMGSIVETLGVINTVGFTPLSAGALPEAILDLELPHVRNQDMIVEAGLEGDLDKALFALYNDPLCAHLTLPEIKEMGMRLLKAHERYLPQFFRK